MGLTPEQKELVVKGGPGRWQVPISRLTKGLTQRLSRPELVYDVLFGSGDDSDTAWSAAVDVLADAKREELEIEAKKLRASLTSFPLESSDGSQLRVYLVPVADVADTIPLMDKFSQFGLAFLPEASAKQLISSMSDMPDIKSRSLFAYLGGWDFALVRMSAAKSVVLESYTSQQVLGEAQAFVLGYVSEERCADHQELPTTFEVVLGEVPYQRKARVELIHAGQLTDKPLPEDALSLEEADRHVIEALFGQHAQALAKFPEGSHFVSNGPCHDTRMYEMITVHEGKAKRGRVDRNQQWSTNDFTVYFSEVSEPATYSVPSADNTRLAITHFMGEFTAKNVQDHIEKVGGSRLASIWDLAAFVAHCLQKEIPLSTSLAGEEVMAGSGSPDDGEYNSFVVKDGQFRELNTYLPADFGPAARRKGVKLLYVVDHNVSDDGGIPEHLWKSLDLVCSVPAHKIGTGPVCQRDGGWTWKRIIRLADNDEFPSVLHCSVCAVVLRFVISRREGSAWRYWMVQEERGSFGYMVRPLCLLDRSAQEIQTILRNEGWGVIPASWKRYVKSDGSSADLAPWLSKHFEDETCILVTPDL